MTTDEYDQLLEDIRNAKGYVASAMEQLQEEQAHLNRLLSRLGREDHRLAQQALAHMPIASRKLVVGE